MRFFRFRGDPRNGDGPEEITAFGLTFGRGEPTGVESDAIANTLAANSHFQEMVRDDPPDDEAAPRRRGRPPKQQ